LPENTCQTPTKMNKNPKNRPWLVRSSAARRLA
jgi:hypothetical protein